MKIMIKKYTIAICVLLTLLCSAAQAAERNYSAYIDALKSGKYYISCALAYNMGTGSRMDKSRSQIKLGQDSSVGLKYYRSMTYCPSNEAPYMFAYLESKDGKESYYLKYSKKILDESRIKIKIKTYKGNSDGGINSYVKEEKIKAEEEVFSLLGPITAGAQLYKRYAVKYKESGKEVHQGKEYEYDEYEILTPYAAGLRLYFIDNKLVKCIKTIKSRSKGHWLFSDVALDEAGFVVADIKTFESSLPFDAL